MVRKIGVVLVSLGMLLTACTSSGQRATPVPGDGDKVSQQRLGPVPSAAAPGVPLEGALVNTDQILNQAKAAIIALNLSGPESGYKEFRTEAPQLVFTCQYSPGDIGEEVPLLACKFGEFVNTMSGHALLWHDGTEWQAQLYPEAPPVVTQARHSYFKALGENCPIGCGSEFRTLHQTGPELLTVVDLSGVSTRSTQEVHVLKREGQQWRVLWVPDPDVFRFSGHPHVTFPTHVVEKFLVSYDEGTSQTWVRQGTDFVRSGP